MTGGPSIVTITDRLGGSVVEVRKLFEDNALPDYNGGMGTVSYDGALARYRGMKRDRLRDLLRMRGHPTSGLRGELEERFYLSSRREQVGMCFSRNK